MILTFWALELTIPMYEHLLWHTTFTIIPQWLRLLIAITAGELNELEVYELEEWAYGDWICLAS